MKNANFSTNAAQPIIGGAGGGGGGGGGLTGSGPDDASKAPTNPNALYPTSPSRGANRNKACRPARISTTIDSDVTDEVAADEYGSRKRRESPCEGMLNTASRGEGRAGVMDMDEEDEEGGGRGGGGSGGRERSITAFSPYAARLGCGRSPEDEVAG